MALANAPFNEALTIPLTDNAQLDLSLRQLLLQLVVKREALGTVLRSRSEDIGQSSVNTLSSNLSYNLGVYNNQLRNGGSNTSSYLSLNNVTALREHHVVLDGSLYGIGSGQQDSELYKAMYERDFAGHRFAGGMLDTWNLQSLGPMTAISAGKIYGLSWGNQASSTIFDSSQSATPVIAFLPAAGEVHLTRDGRLLSVQNFTMGNHEVDTRGLPYGIYDVEVEVIVNGRVISKRTQRVNKLFSRGRGVGAPLAWQVWGGSFHMDRWSENGKKTRPAKESWLAGASTSGSLSTLSWAATGYGYDNQAVGETRLTLPLGGAINVNLQNSASVREFARLQIAFAHCLRMTLRKQPQAEVLAHYLKTEDLQRVLASNSPANRILLIMGEWLAVQRRNGQLSDILFISLNDRLNDISAVLAGCERIAYTPIPFAYTLILHRTVYLFCIMLPFALVVDLHYMTPFISVLISYTFISLDCLAEELEDPFGTENNDLPLDAICNAIEIDLLQMNDEAEIPAKILPDRHYQLT